MKYLDEHNIGYPIAGTVVPIVPAAILMDLGFGGQPKIRPGADCGYKAAQAATDGPVTEGNVGAGAGATVGKMHRGRGLAGMKGGLGTASLKLGDVVIGALAVVNAAGDILDWRSGKIVAGARRKDGTLADSVDFMRGIVLKTPGGALEDEALRSTTLVVVATNVELTKTALTKLAMMANCGAGRAIRPYHTTGDGDQLFAVSTARLQRPDVPLTVLGSLAADVVAEAIVRGVRAATSIEGWMAVRDL
jgi:L-aminopeptidase/D-esterase-like protein